MNRLWLHKVAANACSNGSSRSKQVWIVDMDCSIDSLVVFLAQLTLDKQLEVVSRKAGLCSLLTLCRLHGSGGMYKQYSSTELSCLILGGVSYYA